MKGDERRLHILNLLKESKVPIKGGELADRFSVTRQVIVQDIAILKAQGHNIVSTPQGYIFLGGQKSYSKVIAVKHSKEEIEDELKTIVSLGGKVIDVTIEHKVYGEITGKLMLKSFYDVEKFLEKLRQSKDKPLLDLTDGVHLHTIEAETQEDLQRIVNALKERGYVIYD
ncbi:hypothetical protein SAMN05660865_01747 [Caloramator fervidus]|uniref:Transcriptional regulator n=1 Tax=Caloramator fervidus TaxID=29344 RepID=A0A1H5XEX2_9CLOT|nr:transcription repressor NadR [Caloramator fervidus]SEG10308.1 hypothetical protein SAMN05660865_01747 [Caloramator fervidus]